MLTLADLLFAYGIGAIAGVAIVEIADGGKIPPRDVDWGDELKMRRKPDDFSLEVYE